MTASLYICDCALDARIRVARRRPGPALNHSWCPDRYAGSVLGYPVSVLGYPVSVLGYPESVIGYPGSMLGYPGSVLGYPGSVHGQTLDSP
eukprot:2892138-Pyramimonas_sp.AAC.2